MPEPVGGIGGAMGVLASKLGLGGGDAAPAVAQPAAAPYAMGLSGGWRQRLQQQQPMMRLGPETPGAQVSNYPQPSALQMALNAR